MESGISVRDVLYIVFKRKSLVLAFMLLTLVGATFYSLSAARVYQADARLFIKLGRENLYTPVLSSSEQTSPIFNQDFEGEMNSEIEIIRSLLLAEKVLRSYGPAEIYPDLATNKRPGLFGGVFGGSDKRSEASILEAAVQRFSRNLKVEAVKKTKVINVSFTHGNPKIAAEVLNTLITYYLDRHLDVHQDPKVIDFFEKKSEGTKQHLFEAEARLDAFRKAHQLTSSATDQRNTLLEQKKQLTDDYNHTSSDLVATASRVKEIRSQLRVTPQVVSLDTELDHSPLAVTELQGKLFELQAKERDLRNRYSPESRLVKKVEEDLALIRGQMKSLESKRAGKTRTGLNLVYQSLQQQLYQSEADLQALSAKKAKEEAQLADFQDKLKEINRIEVQYVQLQQEVEVSRQNYKLYLGRLEDSRTSNAMDSEKITNVSLLDPARPPLQPTSPKVKLNLMLALVLGPMLGVMFAIAAHRLDDSLDRTEDIERLLDMPVLASIPDLDTDANSGWRIGYS